MEILGISVIISEIASVFVKGDQRYILYYPGTDHNEPTSFLLCNLIVIADQKLKRQLDDEFELIPKLFCIGENGTKFGRSVHHFVFALYDPKEKKLTIEDSKNLVLGVKVNTDKVFPVNIAQSEVKHLYRGWQGVTQTWQCGHYVIEAMLREVTKKTPAEHLKINENMIKLHKAYYNFGINPTSDVDEDKKEEWELIKRMNHLAPVEVKLDKIKNTYDLMNAANEQFAIFFESYEGAEKNRAEKNKELALTLKNFIESQLKTLNESAEDRSYLVEQNFLAKLFEIYNSALGASPSASFIGRKLKGEISDFKTFLFDLTKALFADYLPKDCKIETMHELVKVIDNEFVEKMENDASKLYNTI